MYSVFLCIPHTGVGLSAVVYITTFVTSHWDIIVWKLMLSSEIVTLNLCENKYLPPIMWLHCSFFPHYHGFMGCVIIVFLNVSSYRFWWLCRRQASHNYFHHREVTILWMPTSTGVSLVTQEPRYILQPTVSNINKITPRICHVDLQKGKSMVCRCCLCLMLFFLC